MIPFLLLGGSITAASTLAGKMILGATVGKVAKDTIDEKIEDAYEEGFKRASKVYEEK